MALSDIEIRILGCLVEKESTTPEAYPLTTNSLVLACNQKTNRDPVTEYIEHDIASTLQNLRDKGLVTTTRAANERVYKHQHKLAGAWELNARQLAIMAVLMLRGKQTPGELRQRTDRYTSFSDLDEVEAVLESLSSRTVPLVKNYGRGPGQSQDRWGHLMGGDEEKQRPRVRLGAEKRSELEELREELSHLQALVAKLYDHLGLDTDS